jgi:hypothetical protein
MEGTKREGQDGGRGRRRGPPPYTALISECIDPDGRQPRPRLAIRTNPAGPDFDLAYSLSWGWGQALAIGWTSGAMVPAACDERDLRHGDKTSDWVRGYDLCKPTPHPPAGVRREGDIQRYGA